MPRDASEKICAGTLPRFGVGGAAINAGKFLRWRKISRHHNPQPTVNLSTTALNDLLSDELQDLYNAENQRVKALPRMAKAAVNPQLKAGFLAHLEETKGHVDRLTKAFKLLDEPVKGKLCHAMKGLVQEGAEAIEDNDPSLVRDAQLIGAAQRVEHYEMAGYGTVRAIAEVLGEDEVAKLAQQTLDEEGATDKKLPEISKKVNTAALNEVDDE